MFNKFNLSDEEIAKIIKKYEKLIIKKSQFNEKLNEDMSQEIRIEIGKNLSKFDKN